MRWLLQAEAEPDAEALRQMPSQVTIRLQVPVIRWEPRMASLHHLSMVAYPRCGLLASAVVAGHCDAMCVGYCAVHRIDHNMSRVFMPQRSPAH